MNGKREFDELSRAIGRLEGTVKTGFQNVYRKLNTTNGQLRDHDDRINTNKEEIDKRKGMMIVIGAGASIIISLISSWIKTFFGIEK